MSVSITEARETNQKTADVLLEYIREAYERRHEQVVALSEVVYFLALQDLSPEDVLENENPAQVFRDVDGLSTASRGIDDLTPDLKVAGTPLGKRWRTIRAKVLRGLL